MMYKSCFIWKTFEKISLIFQNIVVYITMSFFSDFKLFNKDLKKEKIWIQNLYLLHRHCKCVCYYLEDENNHIPENTKIVSLEQTQNYEKTDFRFKNPPGSFDKKLPGLIFGLLPGQLPTITLSLKYIEIIFFWFQIT